MNKLVMKYFVNGKDKTPVIQSHIFSFPVNINNNRIVDRQELFTLIENIQRGSTYPIEFELTGHNLLFGGEKEFVI